MHIINRTNIGNASVGTTSIEITAANEARKWIVICNPSDTGVYLNFGAAAEASKGIYLGARGGVLSYTEGDVHISLAVYAITASGSGKTITYLEGL